MAGLLVRDGQGHLRMVRTAMVRDQDDQVQVCVVRTVWVRDEMVKFRFWIGLDWFGWYVYLVRDGYVLVDGWLEI